MSRIVGWIILSRRTARADTLDVLTAVDRELADTAEAALDKARPKLEGPVFRMEAFGVTTKEMDTKLNLAKTLTRLGLQNIDVDAAYNGIYDILAKNAAEISS